MRAPFQVLAIPYRKENEYLFCVFHRADIDRWQFVSGGGEDNETPREAAIREIREETGILHADVQKLTSMAYVPAYHFQNSYRQNWSKDTYVLPEYHFAFACDKHIQLSDEHTECVWLNYKKASEVLKWDSNKTALYELNCRLPAE